MDEDPGSLYPEIKYHPANSRGFYSIWFPKSLNSLDELIETLKKLKEAGGDIKEIDHIIISSDMQASLHQEQYQEKMPKSNIINFYSRFPERNPLFPNYLETDSGTNPQFPSPHQNPHPQDP